MTITTSEPVAKPKRVRRALWLVLLWLMVLPGTAWAVVRQGGWERDLAVQLFAFTPYVAAWSLIPALLALATRRWLVAAVACATAAIFAVAVVPRAVADSDRGPDTGVAIRVMTSNMLFGRADAEQLVDLVRANGVALLAVQEFAPSAEANLAAAGLSELLPYHSLGAEPGASGSGLYSRFPLTDAGISRNSGGFNQAYGTVQPPGAVAFEIESAHPNAPYAVSALPGWRKDLNEEPRADPDGSPRILLGDFNATLDHDALRRLIASGYRDAADAAGQGLIGTWGPYDGDPLPPVTIDHVLVDERIGVRDVDVHRITGSDHRAIIAEVVIPAA